MPKKQKKKKSRKIRVSKLPAAQESAVIAIVKETENPLIASNGPDPIIPDPAPLIPEPDPPTEVMNIERAPEPTEMKEISEDEKRKRVFVMHNRSRLYAYSIERLLDFGEMNPVTDDFSSSRDAIVGMKSCGAAIFHVDAEEANDPDLLLKIGAAVALFGNKVVLLSKETTELPPGFKNIPQVQYSENDNEITIKIIDEIQRLKSI